MNIYIYKEKERKKQRHNLKQRNKQKKIIDK
jgi:hypothetical protein